MKRTLFSGLLVTLALSGCALMSPQSDYSNTQEDEYASYAAQKSGTAEAFDELGWAPSKKLTAEEQETLERRIQLKRLEQAISTEREREQYFNFKAYLDDDEERIAFLSLPTMDARDRYAMQKGIYYRTNKFTPVVRDAVSRADIVLGMNKDAVKESWGEPIGVEVAGSELYGNERWTYIEYISTPEGFEKEERVVIFEAGKVVGWQKN